MAELNATIEEVRTISKNDKPVATAGEENKDEIFFIMAAFEDFFIRFAEEKLNDTRRKFTYRSNLLGKYIFGFVCEFVEGGEIFHQVFQGDVKIFLFH